MAGNVATAFVDRRVQRRFLLDLADLRFCAVWETIGQLILTSWLDRSQFHLAMSDESTVLLRLEGFSPPWRQAVVVSAKSSGKLHLAARVLEGELADQTLTVFKVDSGSGIFSLVEGDWGRVRSACAQAQGLGDGSGIIREKALQVQAEEESVHYATASEDLPEEASKPLGRKTVLQAPVWSQTARMA